MKNSVHHEYFKVNLNELSEIAKLAHLSFDEEHLASHANDLTELMKLASQLQKVPTTDVAPLFHPLQLFQRLRVDEVCHTNHVEELASRTKSFDENLFWVPKVIDSGK